jgi:hypothetical protein
VIEVKTAALAARVEASVSDLGYLYYNIDDAKGGVWQEHLSASLDRNYLLCSEATAQKLGIH